MADKSFGVKELNLLNASGTPTVTSPNNLNLNANTVAISTSCTIGNNLTVTSTTNSANLNVTGIGTLTRAFVTDLSVSGIVTATTFSGSGASLTNLPAANLTGALPAISGANLTGITAGISTDPSNVQATWKLGGGSGSGFTFTGPGQDGSEGNPDIYLVRGQRYLFDNTTLAGNHPFEFRNQANDADYTDGVSGAQNGLQYINVQHDAPSALKYRCTIHTTSMLGNIYIIGGKRGILTQNTTLTGSSLTFDGLPSWVTKITVNLLKASLSSNDEIYVRLRTGSSSITSDYSCVSGNFQGNLISSKTDAFNINTTSGSQLLSGSMVIEKIDSAGLKYVQSHMTLCTNNNSRHGGGNLERSSGNAIDGVEITVEGSNTFDSGVVTIYYE